MKRQKAIEQELGCIFVRTNPYKEDLSIIKAINEIFRKIKQSTKKTVISKISTPFLGLEFKPHNIIKSKATKFIVNKIFPDYKQKWKCMCRL